MRRIIIWATCCALLLITGYAYAQSSPDAWPIVEHCIGSVTKPPTDWRFDGTLFLSSFERLHAYHEGWETPRILVFYSSDIPSSGQLSPDGKWFATINGMRKDNIGVGYTEWQTRTIVVYSTENDQKYIIPWRGAFVANHRLDGHTLYWLDNQHLLYSKDDQGLNEEWFKVNPFTKEITPQQSKISPSQFNFVFSPNHKSALYNDWGDLFWTLTDGDQEIRVPIISDIIWSPDSSRFAANTVKPDRYEADGLAIFDLSGKLVENVFNFSDADDTSWRVGQTWSPDGQYLLFAASHLYLADMTARKVIDTCIPTRAPTVAWSPQSHQFALIDTYVSDRQVQIFDLDRWARYIVAYHSGSVIGWRSDD